MTDQYKPDLLHASPQRLPRPEGVGKDMTYSEDDLIQLSALQHMVFCERKCALMQLLGTASLNAAKRGGLLA